MKTLFTILLILSSFAIYSQQTIGRVPSTPPTIPDSVFVTPIGETLDTIKVYAVLATLKQPLTLQKYNYIVKSYLFPKGIKKPFEEWMEKEVMGPGNKISVIKIRAFKKRLLYYIKAEDFEE